MPKYAVILEKTYYSKDDPDETETILGILEVEADSPGAAVSAVEAQLRWYNEDGTSKNGLQTADPRIAWDELTYLTGPAEYADFTFGIAQEQLPPKVAA